MKELEEIKERAEAATKGPWEVESMDSGHSRYEMYIWVQTLDGDSICDMAGLERSYNEKTATDDGYRDAIFIAHARTDVPRLVAALEAVQALPHADYCCTKGCPGFGNSLCDAAVIDGFICDGTQCTCDLRPVLDTINKALGEEA